MPPRQTLIEMDLGDTTTHRLCGDCPWCDADRHRCHLFQVPLVRTPPDAGGKRVYVRASECAQRELLIVQPEEREALRQALRQIKGGE